MLLQFKWQDPEETGGRPITRYQALALRRGSGSDLDPAAVGFISSHACTLIVTVSMQESYYKLRQESFTTATARDDPAAGVGSAVRWP